MPLSCREVEGPHRSLSSSGFAGLERSQWEEVAAVPDRENPFSPAADDAVGRAFDGDFEAAIDFLHLVAVDPGELARRHEVIKLCFQESVNNVSVQSYRRCR